MGARWLYCFGCQSSHLHDWDGKKWRCSNCETKRNAGPEDDTTTALRWAGAGAEASDAEALEQMREMGQ